MARRETGRNEGCIRARGRLRFAMPCRDARVNGETGASGAREYLQSLRDQEKREGFSCLPGAANLALPNRGAVASGVGFWSSDWDRF